MNNKKKKKKKYPGVSQANWMHVGLVSSWCRLHGTKKSIDSKKKGFSSLWAVRNPGFCSSLVNFNCSVHGRN
jgi:hypothetical protein